MTATRAQDETVGQTGEVILQAEDVTMRFGGLTAVDSVNFTVRKGEIMGLIGPNGAGKTTFFNCLTGLYLPTSGRVVFNGAVLPPKPRKVVMAGMARTFQNIRLFGNMTALENVMVGRYCRTTTGPFTSIIRGPKFRRDEKAVRERSQELLEFVGLGHTTDHLARNLPYGDQRRLEIARALATDPKLILLDEPTAGMNPQESAQFNEFVYRVRDDQGISVLLIEHDMSVIMKISERITVLDRGVMIAEGTPDDIRSNQTVIEAYLGKTGTREGKRNKT
jgi:branched-chain amino acid transport system ATP-binding protein